MSNMITTIKSAFRNPDLRKRMIFTLVMIAVFRIGGKIPVPFIDRVAFTQLIQRFGSLGNMMDIISGGALNSVSIFALGIQPYINSSIIIQLLTVAIPALENLSKEGEVGRKKIQAIVRYMTVGLSLLQAFAFWYATRSTALTEVPAYISAAIIIATFTAGSTVVMWIGESINDKGIGNGISILIFAGIISRIPNILRASTSYLKLWSANYGVALGLTILLVLFAVVLSLLLLVIYVSQAERRIPIQYAKRVVGRKQMGGQSTYLPIKVNQSSVMPVIFAMSILQIPSLIISFFFINSTGPVVTWFRQLPGNPIYFLFQVILIVAFTFFYSSIQYNPREIANNLQKNGGFIPGHRPGRPTTEYIAKSAHRLNWADGIFLSMVTVIPAVMGLISNAQGLWFGGTGVIILVGVCIDTVKTLESQLMVRNYQGFLD